MDFPLLADLPESAPTIAKWYYQQWGHAAPNASIDSILQTISRSTNRLGPPLIVLARLHDQLIGAAELKYREMQSYPEYEYWLGGVYVDQPWRHCGMAVRLTQEVITHAQAAGIKTLYLQTEDLTGGLYSRLGFEKIDRVFNRGHGAEVLIMNKTL